MSDLRTRFERWEQRLGTPRARIAALVAVLALAALLRGVFFAQVAETDDFGRLAVDAQGYDRQARGILEGDWPGDEVFYQDALYPYFLAWHYETLGEEPREVFRTQVLIGIVAVGLMFLLASIALGPLAGLVAGVLAATYGPFLFYETLLLKTALSVACTSAFLVAVVLARRRAWPSALVCGLFLGLACLLRGNLLALVPIAAVWLAWKSAGALRQRLLRVLALGVGVALAISPVTLHNLRAGEFVLITSQAGQNFHIGNNPLNESGSYVPPAGVRGIQEFEQVDFARLAEAEVGRPLSVRERSAFWFDKSFAWFREDPGAALALQGTKLSLFLNHLEVPDNADYLTTRDEVPLLRAPLASFALLLILASAALVLVRWTPELGLLVTIAATIAATVVAFFVFSRYRLTIVPVLIVLASALPRAVVLAWSERRHVRIALAALVALGVGLFTYRDVWTGNRSMLHYNRALFALEDEEQARALEHLESALEIDPANGYALTLRGQLKIDQGRVEEGLADLFEAVRRAPGSPEASYKLGLALEQARREPEALDAYRAALAAEPTYDVAAVAAARIERRRGEPELARDRLQTILRRRPKFVPALSTLGSLELQLDRPERALPFLERAAALRPGDVTIQRDLDRCRRRLGDG